MIEPKPKLTPMAARFVGQPCQKSWHRSLLGRLQAMSFGLSFGSGRGGEAMRNAF